jgi:UDP-2,3-diacylglucosamine pyrophosphatase LpxH
MSQPGHRLFRVMFMSDVHLGTVGLPYRPFTKSAKARVRETISDIDESKKALPAEVRRNRTDGVIGGHIDHAVDRRFLEMRYGNRRDWVENCSTAVGYFDGVLEIVTWTSIGSQDVEDATITEAQPARCVS